MSTPAPATAGSTRRALERIDRPPPVAVRFFFTSPLAIDDPLSPLPPPSASGSTASKVPPRPFSAYDNAALEKAWMDVRRKRLKLVERGTSEKRGLKDGDGAVQDVKYGGVTNYSPAEAKRRSIVGAVGSSTPPSSPRRRPQRMPSSDLLALNGRSRAGTLDSKAWDGSKPSSLRTTENASFGGSGVDTSTVTGNPFVRAPDKMDTANSSRSQSTFMRPLSQKFDSYDWNDAPAHEPCTKSREPSRRPASIKTKPAAPTAKVCVGVSRLHEVIVPDLQMEPIYWSPVNDIASVVRATWFYAENYLPVEVDVANMLEAGYVDLRAWSQTWKDELASAVEVGAAGEEKIMHRLWPDKPRKAPGSRPGTSRDSDVTQMVATTVSEDPDPEKERQEIAATAGDLIDIAAGPDGPDNKAAGSAPYGRDGTVRRYAAGSVIYANEREAYILRPKLQPSAYYGRRPLANYIRKGHKIGVKVIRGFDQHAWDKLHPAKNTSNTAKAQKGVSTAQAGVDPFQRQGEDPTLGAALRPHVTDLVFVIHGIGQKLSERMESYHFTHAINSFRREVNVELGTESVKAQLRPDIGGIMVLPVNWRLTLSFEEGGYRPDDFEEDPARNVFTLKDITPDTLPSVRNIVSDVMLDIPYYLSAEHNPKMLQAVVREANRIYRLWCANNPGFADWGRVHIIAHSLGSVMALDVLSNQPTRVSSDLSKIPVDQPEALPTHHFLFNTHSLFFCGSPSGFFLLLRKGSLLPRRDSDKPEAVSSPGVAGEQGTYGCLAVNNIYNVINPYDPVAYRLNACVDVTYAASLKPAWIPSSQSSWFSVFSRAGNPTLASAASGVKPTLTARLPSNVELETHDFTREEIAEKRAYCLNDNGQIDYFLRYGGGPLEIQYLTMLGAHSSYWVSKDFIRMIVIEVGRVQSKDGTLTAMRAQKKKKVAT